MSDFIPSKSAHVGASASASSDVTQSRTGASERLLAFLSAVAPLDRARLTARAARLLAELPSDVSAAAAVEHAQTRLSVWWQRAFAAPMAGDVHARRAMLRLPDAFLSDDPAQLRALRELRHDLAEPAVLPEQRLASSRLRALVGLVPACLLGSAAAVGLAHAVTAPPWLSVPWALLFGLLVALHGNALTLVLLGLVRRAPNHTAASSGAALPPTAIVMPIYEEDPERVFAALAAMREALLRSGRADAVVFYVLSDTQDPLRAADEERAWRRLAALTDGHVPVYYRRRAKNVGKKAGNLAEFAVRNGQRFTYALVLDADSLMGADTIITAIERMEASPRLGLLQCPIELRGGETLFARALQFAHAVGGPLLMRGLARWSGPDGNYFGHNAVVRLDAFVACCGLPTLAGAPPLGGPILSHDFVEAALLRRGGWEVRFADDLGESFEEPPPTLADYLTRDRRWCQGNLQHLRVVTAHGLAPLSRVHLLLGAFAYLASPLWLAFVLLGIVASARGAQLEPLWTARLTLAAFAILLLPRVLGLLAALPRRRAFGGFLRLLTSAALELVISALLAPVLMLAHTGFVFEILLGQAVDWRAQRRSAADSGSSLDGRALLTSLLGAVCGGLLVAGAPAIAWLLAPVWLPWLLALPLASVLARPAAGRATGRAGLLDTPVETKPPAIVRAAERHRDYFHADETARFRDVVLDPVLNAARRSQLTARGQVSDPTLAATADKALGRGPAALSPRERARLLDDPLQLERLHEYAWRDWPVETWNLPRPVHHEP